MAIFHLNVKTISRASETRGIGHSVFAAVAYAGGLRLKGGGQTHNWTRKALEVVRAEVIAMDCSPACFAHRCEEKERRWDSRVGRTIIAALPKECSDEERWKLAKGYALSLRDRYGCASYVAVHRPGENDRTRDNHHVHFVLSTRRLEGNSFGQKIRVLDNPVSSRAEVNWMREQWEKRINSTLEKHQVPAVSRAAVRDRPAARKMSSAQAAMNRRGIKTRAFQANRILRRLAGSLQNVEAQIEELTGLKGNFVPKVRGQIFPRRFQSKRKTKTTRKL